MSLGDFFPSQFAFLVACAESGVFRVLQNGDIVVQCQRPAVAAVMAHATLACAYAARIAPTLTVDICARVCAQCVPVVLVLSAHL